jgi:hypothetical protein
MTPEDFRRNFQQSYLGIVPSVLAGPLKEAGLWERLDLNNKQALLPATTPQHGPSGMSLNVVLKFIDDTYMAYPVMIPWVEDFDEKTELCDARHPRIGMTESEDTIVFLRRYPKREYHRGYCPRSTSLCAFNAVGAALVRSSTPSVVWNVFNPVYRTLNEAMDILESGLRIGVVLGRFLGIVIEQSKKYPRLVYRHEVVGIVQNGDPIVYEDSSMVARDYIAKVTGKIPKVK